MDEKKNILSDETSKETLSKLLRNVAMQRRQQDTTLKSVLEQNFTSQFSSSSTQTMATSTTSSSSSSSVVSRRETTGGNETVKPTDNEEKRNEATKSMMELSACQTGKTSMFAQQQQNIASSSLSSETVKRTKTLSFLHNEDLFDSAGMTMMPQAVTAAPKTSLFRSMSFQERRLHHQATIKRVESGKELKTSSNLLTGMDAGCRKVAILSPKHSLQELNERIKHLQQQMFGTFDSSSDLSL
ncbi:hypothetical protein PVAND_012186 [Polypedilum vanderplanki]|uniref:Uncharacterized protein n=1 Tax=Polypedilum vanderplanki TaxID=319348 RepID=A0A9J6CKU8_POLVA|nr:hypothetical protein PVAND_012186 [Polypedilum vanderplanki]